jgi:putative glycosyltransferase (TIGR04372 family)
MPGVIDYANSKAKSDWMDVFLCANCKFFLGNSSGLCFLAAIFGVHSALANMIPVSGALPVGRGDVGIPKLLRSRKSGQLLSYRDVLASPVSNFRYASQYEEADITVEENAPEDIRDLTLEILARVSGTGIDDAADDRLQEKFQQMMRPGHYSFGADSRIGRDFLRKYARLL